MGLAIILLLLEIFILAVILHTNFRGSPTDIYVENNGGPNIIFNIQHL